MDDTATVKDVLPVERSSIIFFGNNKVLVGSEITYSKITGAIPVFLGSILVMLDEKMFPVFG